MNTAMGLMAGKRGIVMGVANDRSIAWGVAQALSDQGAELAFTYQDAFESRVRRLVERLGSNIVLPCDVGDQTSIYRKSAVHGKRVDPGGRRIIKTKNTTHP